MNLDCRDLRDFAKLLTAQDELRRVRAEVDPDLEIAAITDRVCKQPGGGPALWFEQVRKHSAPVLTNLFGSARRVAWALGVESLDQLAGRMENDLQGSGPGNGEERLRRLTENPAILPRWVVRPPCHEVVEEAPDITTIPALRSWPGDGGRYFTLPLIFTRDPSSGRSNCGMYRVQVLDSRTALIHWRHGSDGARHYSAFEARGRPMPAAIALGGDPALIYAAGAPIPGSIPEADFAGYLRQRPIELAKCLTSNVEVPATAEYVIEGYLRPGEAASEGPFGNHTGVYAPAVSAPIFNVTALTHRRNPLYPATVVGPPPMEDCFLAKASERLLLPLLRQDHPELLDFHFPPEGVFHGCVLLSLRRGEGGGAKKVMRRLWSSGLLKDSRLMVAFADGVDIQQPSVAYWRAVNGVDPRRDLLVENGKLGIDATASPEVRVAAAPETLELLNRRWQEYGLD